MVDLVNPYDNAYGILQQLTVQHIDLGHRGANFYMRRGGRFSTPRTVLALLHVTKNRRDANKRGEKGTRRRRKCTSYESIASRENTNVLFLFSSP